MRMSRIIGGNIRPPHLKWIEAAETILQSCAHTMYGCAAADDPAVDFKPGTERPLAGSRLVDGERYDVFWVSNMGSERIYFHPCGHVEWFSGAHVGDEVASTGR